MHRSNDQTRSDCIARHPHSPFQLNILISSGSEKASQSPLICDSSKLDGTLVGLIGRIGHLDTDKLIIAARHNQTIPDDAGRLGVADGMVVDAHIAHEERGLVFGKTLIRVGPESVA
jgi:acetate kinase